ncbi:GyrI-like domain-containing protein [Sporolactobacillus shoreicorticis]|uniref:GyrI-like domain-containing protein n=1 Tax=Sporolactobacillus shoreicorticis TaxID=1923877 RepID=A0ABW5S382_9BACL|nr:GyrI-like domain-containing protein [Sporolactobacillus shoreicorticis]MCO7125366.1 GyrI-like domain-containing protein [Sporolactobacillus shoreicorticis]
MNKVDYKKDFKELYLPKQKPVIVRVPEIRFAMIEGSGDPNGERFSQATAALYSLSYAVKMSYKSKLVPEGYYEYIVFPLEGIWDLVDKTVPTTVKSNFKYTLMIRQPDFLTNELFERFLSETKKKKPNPLLDKVRFSAMDEGLCCQMLHKGSYDDEPASFERMAEFCSEQGYLRTTQTHREIYLSDPRRTAPEKVKTVLRYQVEKK